MAGIPADAEGRLSASHGRTLNYLRLSVTDRCNLRCRYCMPQEGVPKLEHPDILSYEEYLRLLTLAASLGVTKLRLTGGEPLVRRGLVDFIGEISRRKLFQSLALTTNAVMLAPLAEALKAAGVTAVNISLDALNPALFAELAGRPGPEGEQLFHRAWRGFEAALATGFDKIKINCVPIRGVNDEELPALAGLAGRYPVEVRFIEYMPIGPEKAFKADRLYPTAELKAELEKRLGPLTPLARPGPAGPAKMYQPAGAPGAVGFISAMSDHFCRHCNRLRVTADGKLKPCLMSREEIDLRQALRAGAGQAELLALFRLAAHGKPETYQSMTQPTERQMNGIGG